MRITKQHVPQPVTIELAPEEVDEERTQASTKLINGVT